MKTQTTTAFGLFGLMFIAAALPGVASVKADPIVEEPGGSMELPETVKVFENPERFIVGAGVINPLPDDDSLYNAVNAANPSNQNIAEGTGTDRQREGQQVVDGTQFSVVSPIYLGTSGDNVSFLRFSNLGTTEQRIVIDVVGSPSGTQYGPSSVQTTLPPLSSRQFNVEDDFFSLFDSLALEDTSRSIYLREPDSTNQLRFQHIVFNVVSRFFENVSVCYDQTIPDYEDANQVLINVHTTSIPDFPSTITIHNYADETITYRIDVFEAFNGTDTGSGGFTNELDFVATANTTYLVPFSEFQTQLSWSPTSSQLHANLFFARPDDPSNFEAVVGHTVFNAEQDSLINMTTHCGIRIP